MRSRVLSNGFVLLGLPLLFYLAFPTRNFYWDGVAFATQIEKRLLAAELIHPNHLIYTLWGASLYRFSTWLGIRARALFVLQGANSVFAEGCVLLFYRLLRLRNIQVAFALAGALLFGFSATWWKFATDADAYVPSIFFLLAAAVLIERKNTGLAGFANAGAMLFHELGILFLPVALFRLRNDRRAMSAYMAAALAPVAASYVIAYKTAAPPLGFFQWITRHSPDAIFSFHIAKNIWMTVQGTIRLLAGGRVRDFVLDWPPVLICGAILLTGLAFALRKYSDKDGRVSLTPAILWIAIYMVFLFFWEPQNVFYRLFYLPPLVIVLVAMLRSRQALCICTALIATWNFAFLIYPQSLPGRNAPLKFALAQHDAWPAGTPIVFGRFHPDLWTISYFNRQAAWMSMERLDLRQLDQALDYAHRENKVLFLEATAYDLAAADPAGRAWLAAHEQPGGLVEFRDARHHFVFHDMR